MTKDQQKWLNHLSDTDKIIIKPFDPKSNEIFKEAKNKVIKALGKVKVLERGASYLKISGQDEIDIYVPVDPKDFDMYVEKMTKAFGKPGSNYPSVRARFRISGYQKHIDVFVINKIDKGWIDSEAFTRYLKIHRKALDKYRKLKEDENGLSTKEYYAKKILFINNILKVRGLG
jgi:GrpB-like predicted nucleotidyltransferase (UPF0157 family)